MLLPFGRSGFSCPPDGLPVEFLETGVSILGNEAQMVTPSRELIENLRFTLQKLGKNFESLEEEPAMSELKRLLLFCIADL